MINKTALRKLERATTDSEWSKAVRATKATGLWRGTYRDERKLADLEELKDEPYKMDIPKEVADFIRPGKSKDKSRSPMTMVNVRDRGGMRIIEATDGFQLRWAEVKGVKCGIYHLRETMPQIVWADEQSRFPDTEAIIPKPDQVTPTHWRTVRTFASGEFCYVTAGKTHVNVGHMKGLEDGGQMWEYKGGLTTRPIMYSQYLNKSTPGNWLAMPMHPPR